MGFATSQWPSNLPFSSLEVFIPEWPSPLSYVSSIGNTRCCACQRCSHNDRPRNFCLTRLTPGTIDLLSLGAPWVFQECSHTTSLKTKHNIDSKLTLHQSFSPKTCYVSPEPCESDRKIDRSMDGWMDGHILILCNISLLLVFLLQVFLNMSRND